MKIRQFCAAVQQRKGTAEYPNLLRSRSVLIGQQELEHQDTPLFLESKGEHGALVRRSTEVYGARYRRKRPISPATKIPRRKRPVSPPHSQPLLS